MCVRVCVCVCARALMCMCALALVCLGGVCSHLPMKPACGAMAPERPGDPCVRVQREGSQASEEGRPAGRLLRHRHREAPASAGAHERGAPEEPTARVWGRSPTLQEPPKLRLPRPGAPSR